MTNVGTENYSYRMQWRFFPYPFTSFHIHSSFILGRQFATRATPSGTIENTIWLFTFFTIVVDLTVTTTQVDRPIMVTSLVCHSFPIYLPLVPSCLIADTSACADLNSWSPHFPSRTPLLIIVYNFCAFCISPTYRAIVSAAVTGVVCTVLRSYFLTLFLMQSVHTAHLLLEQRPPVLAKSYTFHSLRFKRFGYPFLHTDW